MDTIALTAFGLKTDSLNDKNSRFVEMAKKGFQTFTTSPLIFITGTNSSAF